MWVLNDLPVTFSMLTQTCIPGSHFQSEMASIPGCNHQGRRLIPAECRSMRRRGLALDPAAQMRRQHSIRGLSLMAVSIPSLLSCAEVTFSVPLSLTILAAHAGTNSPYELAVFVAPSAGEDPRRVYPQGPQSLW